MLKAVKANRVYTITEVDKKRFVADGYDIYEDGVCIEYGAGKTVPVMEYVKALQTIQALEAEIAELRAGKEAKAPIEEAPVEEDPIEDPIEAPVEEDPIGGPIEDLVEEEKSKKKR